MTLASYHHETKSCRLSKLLDHSSYCELLYRGVSSSTDDLDLLLRRSRRRRLRLPVSHRRTSLPRVRRASGTPTPASTPSVSIDEDTPRHTPTTPVRRSARLSKTTDSAGESDTSFVDKRTSKSDASTSRKDSSDVTTRGPNVPERPKRYESGSSEVVEKVTFFSEHGSGGSLNDPNLNASVLDVNVTKRGQKRYAERQESDASELNKKLNAESDGSRSDSDSNKIARDANVTKRGHKGYAKGDESDAVGKQSYLSSDDTRNDSTSDSIGIDANVTKRAQKSYAEQHGIYTEDSHNDFTSEATAKDANVTKRGQRPTAIEDSSLANGSKSGDNCLTSPRTGKRRQSDRQNDAVYKKLRSLFSEEGESQNNSSDTVARDVNVMTPPNVSNFEDGNLAASPKQSARGDQSFGAFASASPRLGVVQCRREAGSTAPTARSESPVSQDQSAENETFRPRRLGVAIRSATIAAKSDDASLDQSEYEQSEGERPLRSRRFGVAANSVTTAAKSDDASLDQSEYEQSEGERPLRSRRFGVAANSVTTAAKSDDASLDQSEYEQSEGERPLRSRRFGVAANSVTTAAKSDDASLDQSEYEQSEGERPLRSRRFGVAANSVTTAAKSDDASLDQSEYEQSEGERPLRSRRFGVAANSVTTAAKSDDASLDQSEYEQSEGERPLRSRRSSSSPEHLSEQSMEVVAPRRPRRGEVNYGRGAGGTLGAGDTPAAAAAPAWPKRVRMDSDTESQNDSCRPGGEMICVRADVHRACSPQPSSGSGSLAMSLTPPASQPHKDL